MSIGQELLNAPFPELVKNLGVGIAEAQFALDKVSVRIAQMMSGIEVDNNGNARRNEESRIKLSENGPSYSLLALGFTPTFYQFVETHIELKMAISMSKSRNFGASASVRAVGFGGGGLVAASVNASYSQKYQYDASGSSEMRTKLVTVPAPVILEQRLKALMDEENQQALVAANDNQ